MSRLGTETNQIEIDDCEIRASLISDYTFSPVSQSLMLRCPHCSADTYLGDQFCQECGVVQPAFEEETGFSPKKLGAKLGESFVINKKKTLLLSGFATALLLIATVCFGVSKQADEVQTCITANRLNDAAAAAERMYVSHFGTLKGRDADLYSEVFHRRAQVYASNQNFKSAICDLAKILPGYSKAAEAAQLADTYRLAMVGTLSPAVSVKAQNSQVSVQSDSNISSAIPQTNFALSGKSAEYRLQQKSVAQTVSVESSKTNPQLNAQKLSTKSAEISVGSESEEGTSEAEEADMAAYNRHLAEYFTRRKSGDGADGQAQSRTTAKEPPSFNEWVQSGKSEF